MIAARQIYLGRGGARLHYDAEVEYLQSTGTQWIDTGVVGGNSTRVVIDIKINRFNEVKGIFGSRIYYSALSSAFAIYAVGNTTGYNSVQFGFSSVSYAYAESHLSFLPMLNRMEVDFNQNVAKVNGDLYHTFSQSSFVTPSSLILFSVHTGADGNTVDSRMVSAMVYGCKIYNGGVLSRDFIPVRFTNEDGQSEGAMYDRANPTVGMNPDGSPRTDGLYRNRGTGAFRYGDDK